MNNTLLNRKNEDFKKECRLINLRHEYGSDYTGAEWGVVTELSEKEVLEKYHEQIARFTPFILLTIDQGNVFTEYKRNEDKFLKRNKKHDSQGFDEELTEKFHPEIVEMSFVEKQELEEYEAERYEKKMELVEKAITSLTEKQRKYLVARFIGGKSARDIAREENVSHQVIDRHLIAGIKKFEKIFKDFF